MEKVKKFWEWFLDFSFNYVSDEEFMLKLMKEYEGRMK